MAQSAIIKRSAVTAAFLAFGLSLLRWYVKWLRRKLTSSSGHAAADATTQEKEKDPVEEQEEEEDEQPMARQLTPEEEIEQNEEFFQLILFMSKVHAFANLDHAEYALVAKAFSHREYKAGDRVIEQDDFGKELLLIADGEAEVFMGQANEQEHLASLTKGDFVGEEAFVRDQKHKATVRATTNLQVHVLSRDDYNKLDLSKKLAVRKRNAVVETPASKTLRKSMDDNFTSKTDEQRLLIKEAILANQKLGPLLSDLKQDELDDIVSHAFWMEMTPGSDVVHQGDITADLFYVIAEGEFDVIVQQHEVAKLKPGQSFGELALLFRAPRAATVRAATKAKLWAVHRYYLKAVLQKPLQKKLEEYAALLGQVDLFKDKSESDRNKLADALVMMTYYKDEYIIHQGEEGDRFYVLYDGEVSVNVNEKEVLRYKHAPGDDEARFFGERALIKQEPRAASIITASDKAKVLALDRDTFLQILKGEDVDKPSRPANFVEYSRQNLQEIGLLGSGGFGAVTLVKDPATGLTFALKALSKGHIVRHHAERSVVNEKTIMRITSNPFLVRLAATFNSDQFLYFLIEPALGGDLITVYDQRNLHGSEGHAKFYLACVLRALEHLHSRYIVYRDLKPENLLIDAHGYCKVADFGLSKFVIGHTYTTCGTPEFFAPEIISGGGYTKAVDWWALGAMVFELMTGQSPFYGHDHMSVMKNIKAGVIRFPSRARDWPDLVRGLCMQDPSERLPLRKGGSSNVEGHIWYTKDSFDWSSFNEQKMTSPYVPEVKSAEDISNFVAAEEDRPPEIKYVDQGTAWDAGFEDAWGPAIFD